MEAFFLSLNDNQKKITAKTYIEYDKKIKDYQKSWKFYLRKQNIGDLMKRFDFKMEEKQLKSYLKKIDLIKSRLK